MSNIRFTAKSLDSDIEIHGSERRRSSVFAGNMLVACLEINSCDWATHVLKPYFPSWVNDGDFAALHVRASYDDIAGYDVFALKLNTMASMGSDFLKLGAYIHGKCEIHGYFMPEDFEWISSAIRSGLQSGFFRQDQGWEDLDQLVNSGLRSPLVMGYSGTGYFPSIGILASISDEVDELEGSMDEGQLWDCCMEAIQAQRIVPGRTIFGHGLNAYQLLTRIKEQDI
jgi:hypothetical protein